MAEDEDFDALDDEVETDGSAEAPSEVGEEVADVGYIKDFISGKLIKATPEEVDAVQVFAQRLVEDYGYPAAQIQTRPQFRVRKRPSDHRKSYPVDILPARKLG